MKKFTRAVLYFVLLVMVGSFVSILLIGCQKKYRPLVVERPPWRMAIGGELDSRQERILYNTMRIIDNSEYKDYKPPHPLGVSGSVSVDHTDNRSTNHSITANKGTD